MLILTRRVGETLTISDDVTVTVLGIKGNQVRVVARPKTLQNCGARQNKSGYTRQNQATRVTRFRAQPHSRAALM